MLQLKCTFYKDYKKIRRKLEEIYDKDSEPDIYDAMAEEYIDKLLEAKKNSKTFFGIRDFPISRKEMKEIKKFTNNFEQKEYILVF